MPQPGPPARGRWMTAVTPLCKAQRATGRRGSPPPRTPRPAGDEGGDRVGQVAAPPRHHRPHPRPSPLSPMCPVPLISQGAPLVGPGQPAAPHSPSWVPPPTAAGLGACPQQGGPRDAAGGPDPPGAPRRPRPQPRALRRHHPGAHWDPPGSSSLQGRTPVVSVRPVRTWDSVRHSGTMREGHRWQPAPCRWQPGNHSPSTRPPPRSRFGPCPPQVVKVSALRGEGLGELVQAILLEAEVAELTPPAGGEDGGGGPSEGVFPALCLSFRC